ncbi:hypothetical protein [Leuconostoc suionicum]|uniref:hypothetical protein n=1 Tax=Leuconostoc suionicum TaxID=1511761 RepID=UPI00300C19B3
MQKATIFRIIATVGILGTVLYEIVTNTNTLYIKIVQAVFMVILWTALAVDRYQHNKSKRELKKDLFLVGVFALLSIAKISFFR